MYACGFLIQDLCVESKCLINSIVCNRKLKIAKSYQHSFCFFFPRPLSLINGQLDC